MARSFVEDGGRDPNGLIGIPLVAHRRDSLKVGSTATVEPPTEARAAAIRFTPPKAGKMARTKEVYPMHANETMLRSAYAMFADGNLPDFLALCPPDITSRVFERVWHR